jgi:hypothetical protein
MASSEVQAKCEAWIVTVWLREKYQRSFSKQRLLMQQRGYFEFDAVSDDQTIVGNISTATATTHLGKVAAGKKSKIRADCLMLSLVDAPTKLLLLTESCMADLCEREQAEGRLPLDISIQHVELRSDLAQELRVAREVASQEVRANTPL